MGVKSDSRKEQNNSYVFDSGFHISSIKDLFAINNQDTCFSAKYK
jgi:hypothetical protein